MKNLVDTLIKGAKKAWNKTKPIILPVVAGVGLYLATSQDISGQSKDKNVYSYENHNKGATIEKDKIRVKDGKDLEIKMIKGRGEYFQNTPLTIKGFPTNPKKISNADLANTFKDTLNLISFYKETAQYDLDAYTKKFLTVSSDKPHRWVKAKDANGNYLNVIPLSLKINPKTGKPEIYAEILCDGQIRKRDGVTDKDASYITKENLEDILKKLTDNLSTLNLNRTINRQKIKTNFYFPSATDSTVYLIPNIEDYTKLRILPATKNEKGVTSRIRQVAIVSPIGVYEKVRTNGEVSIDNVPISKTSGTADKVYHESLDMDEPEKADSITTAKGKIRSTIGINGYLENAYGISTTGANGKLSVQFNAKDALWMGPYATFTPENFSLKSQDKIESVEAVRELVNAHSGTYRIADSLITTNTTTNYPFGFGVSLSFPIAKNAELNLRAGGAKKNVREEVSGEKYVAYERDGEILSENYLSTDVPFVENSSSWVPNAMVSYEQYFGKNKNWSISPSVGWRGDKDFLAELGLNYTFKSKQ